jgi:hypothetical protein
VRLPPEHASRRPKRRSLPRKQPISSTRCLIAPACTSHGPSSNTIGSPCNLPAVACTGATDPAAFRLRLRPPACPRRAREIVRTQASPWPAEQPPHWEPSTAFNRSDPANRGFTYRNRRFDKYSSATIPATPVFACHRNARACDFAQIIFASTDHRASCTRLAVPNALRADLKVGLYLGCALCDPASRDFRSPCPRRDRPAAFATGRTRVTRAHTSIAHAPATDPIHQPPDRCRLHSF